MFDGYVPLALLDGIFCMVGTPCARNEIYGKKGENVKKRFAAEC